MVSMPTSILSFFKPVGGEATSTAAATREGGDPAAAAVLAQASRPPPPAHNTRKRGRQEQPTKNSKQQRGRNAQPRVNESSSIKRDGGASQNDEDERNEDAAAAVDAANNKRIASESMSADRSANHKAEETEEGLSAYEQKRLARMAQNAMFMQQLGMKQAQRDVVRSVKPPPAFVAGTTTTTTKNGTNTSKLLEKLLSARRSRRLQGKAAEGGGILPKPLTLYKLKDGEPELPPAPDSFDDSSVLRYICENTSKSNKKKMIGDGSSVGKATRADCADVHNDQAEPPVQQALVGFSFDANARSMTDPHLKKIYSLSFSPFQENGLIAAGGHQGYVSIYPIDADSITQEDDEESEEAPVAEPLMSFRAHTGWISGVSLAKSIPGEKTGKNILLTAANDSFVKVWDLNQQSASGAFKTAREIYKTNSLHRSGIFGMDTHEDALLTCSKDASVVLSMFRDNSSSLEVVRRFGDHGGVVKSVSFSQASPSQFASGGNDRALRVFDVNVPSTPVLEIRNAHSRAINSVQWHPSNANLLLTASFDPDLHLFDMRKPSLPLFTFRGHYPEKQQGGGIYHPVFVDNGDAIVAAGGLYYQEVSLYRTSDGATVSRGHIGRKTDYIVADPFQERILIASGGSLAFADFKREASSS